MAFQSEARAGTGRADKVLHVWERLEAMKECIRPLFL